MAVGPPSPAQPKKQVAHYQILSELGRGGMGVVYLARDLTLKREVALKSPLPEHATERDCQRLLREARASASLSHPHIVPIFEVLEDDGRPWLAMELVEGRSLRAVLREGGALPVEDTLRHGEALAGALQAAHGRHILHRDVNPNNIMLTADGRVQLMDFGLAQVIVPSGDASSTTTRSRLDEGQGAVAGTPGYMSPEQLLGRPLDPRSDLFSLGAVLYEMCTGAPAFTGPTHAALIDTILNHEPPPVRRLNQAAPIELERLIHKALAKRTDERYQSASDLAVDLRTLRRQLESGRAPIASDAPPGPAAARARWAALAAAAIVAGAIAAPVWTRWSRPVDRPLSFGSSRQITSAPGWEAEPALSPDGGLIAYGSDESGNPDIWIIDVQGGNALRLTDYGGPDRNPAWFPDGSAVAFDSTRGGKPGIWKVARLGGSATPLVPDAQHAAISPDGTRIAFARLGASGQLRIAVAPLRDPTRATILTRDGDGAGEHLSPVWSPDGTMICYAAHRDLWLVPAGGGRPQPLTTDREVHREPVWSPDGRYVYFASYREGTDALWRIPAGGGAPTRVTMGSGPEGHPSISRDGTRLAYATMFSNPDLVLLDLQTGREQRLPGLRYEAEPAFAPDARSVVFGSDRWGGRFDLWIQPLSAEEPAGPDAGGRSPEGPARRVTDHPGVVSHPVYSPDGRWIAYGRMVDAERDIWVVPAAGGAPMRLTDDPATEVHPAWSPDGSRLAFVSEKHDSGAATFAVAVVPIREGRATGPPRIVTSGPSVHWAPVWSPDGTWLAYVGGRDVVDAWIAPLAGGEAPRRVTSGARAARVRWDRLSRLLFVSGFWGGDWVTLRRVDPTDGSTTPLAFPVVFGQDPGNIDFDLSMDGRLLVFTKEEIRSDIWMLETSRRSQ